MSTNVTTEVLAASVLRVVADASGLIISVEGTLDRDTAQTAFETACAAIDARIPAPTIEIDLREMRAWTSAGLQRLSACAGLGVRLRMGPELAAGEGSRGP
jgi:hypothetical protein